MKIEVDVTKDYLTKDVLRLIATYIMLKASVEEMEKFKEHFKQNNWGRQYRSTIMLITFLRWEKPNRFIKTLVPIMLSKSYESEGRDSPSAEIFADIAYVILGLPRPKQKLNKIFVVKEILDFIHSYTANILLKTSPPFFKPRTKLLV